MSNDLKIGESHPIDSNLRPVKVGGEMTSLELANNGARINGDLQVSGNVLSDTIHSGSIIGYTYLQPTSGTFRSEEIADDLTVHDAEHKIVFNTPPSNMVEIELTCYLDIGTTDTRIKLALSDSDTYNEVADEFSYNWGGIFFSDDEANDSTLTAKWVVREPYLADIGSSNTFYIAFSTDGQTKNAYLKYGHRLAVGAAYPPFIVKATAIGVELFTSTY